MAGFADSIPAQTREPTRHSARPGESSLSRTTCWGWLLVGLLVASGCSAYRFGTRSLYPSRIVTIYVPMFESDSFRRNLGERLTEAVVKKINSQTSFRVVTDPMADSTLTGRITLDSKRVTVESATDEPRQAEFLLSVEVTWTDRDQVLLAGGTVQPSVVQAYAQSGLVPEVGQSMVTVQQEVIEDLAAQIVALLENPW